MKHKLNLPDNFFCSLSYLTTKQTKTYREKVPNKPREFTTFKTRLDATLRVPIRSETMQSFVEHETRISLAEHHFAKEIRSTFGANGTRITSVSEVEWRNRAHVWEEDRVGVLGLLFLSRNRRQTESLNFTNDCFMFLFVAFISF